MKKALLAMMLGAVMASTAVTAAPFQDDHHDHQDNRDHHDYVVAHDRGMHEGWYHKGGRVPEEYRDHRYVVDDWHEYHLHQPPQGYQWVRSDTGDFLLVAVASGVITDIMLNH